MVEAIQRVLNYTHAGEAAFRGDPKTQDAVLRNLETLGEAAKRVDDTTRASAPDLPWREISGFRDVLAHDYLQIDLDLVWNVVALELPGLLERLADVLTQLGSDR